MESMQPPIGGHSETSSTFPKSPSDSVPHPESTAYSRSGLTQLIEENSIETGGRSNHVTPRLALFGWERLRAASLPQSPPYYTHSKQGSASTAVATSDLYHFADSGPH